MASTPKEYQALTSLMDRLLTVPKDELDRRILTYKAEADKNPNKRGPKPGKRAVKASASRASGAKSAAKSRR